MRGVTRALVSAAVAVGVILLGATAASAAPRRTMCSGTWQSPGMLTSGTYYGVVVSGVCMIPDGATVRIRGNVTINTAGTLFAITSQRTTVHGNVTIGRAAVLALGCTADLGCDGTTDNPPSADTVYGNIRGLGALAMYLNGDVVHGNVAFRWGGWGPMCQDPNANDPTDPLGHDLVVKDNTFYGSVTLAGWSGCWMGFLRNSVHGNVAITDNYANPANVVNGDPPENQGLDSTEVVANRIWGSLHCSDNTPAAQFGDAVEGTPPGYKWNHVTGNATGECRALSKG